MRTGDPPQSMFDGMRVGDAVGCTCGPYWSVVPPGPCPHHTWTQQPLTTTIPGWSYFTPQLSDDDIERIAKRLAQLLLETPVK